MAGGRSPLDALTDEERDLLRAAEPGFVAPMLATLTDERYPDPDRVFERKLDGVRGRRAHRHRDTPVLPQPHGHDRRLPGARRRARRRPAAGGRRRDRRVRRHADQCVRAQEVVVGGWTDPAGSREAFGALLVGVHDGDALRYAGKVGTGFDDRLLRSLRARFVDLAADTSPFAGAVPSAGAHWLCPDLVARIGSTGWTRDGRLRHPRFEGLREDKDPRDVVREEAR